MIENIAKNLETELPGINSWKRMLVKSYKNEEGRKIIQSEELLSKRKISEMKQAAVLICFFKKDGEYHIPLIRRPMHEKNHPGQIALPGGSREKDEVLQNTALREAFEEVGIEREKVTIIGKLSTLPVPVSKYLISPFIGFTEKEPEWNISHQEVDELIVLKFKDLIESDNGYFEEWSFKDKNLKVPVFKVKNYTIWGATAAILSELIDLSQ